MQVILYLEYSIQGNYSEHLSNIWLKVVANSSNITNCKLQAFWILNRFCVRHKSSNQFEPGVSTVPYSGRVYDHNEIMSSVESCLEFWLTGGHFQKEFEDKLKKYLGARHAMLVNSGSSANLIALSALTSEKLH